MGWLQGQQFARSLNSLMLQMPAAYGAEKRVGKNGHPGAGIARGRAFGAVHTHQHRGRDNESGEKKIRER